MIAPTEVASNINQPALTAPRESGATERCFIHRILESVIFKLYRCKDVLPTCSGGQPLF